MMLAIGLLERRRSGSDWPWMLFDFIDQNHRFHLTVDAFRGLAAERFPVLGRPSRGTAGDPTIHAEIKALRKGGDDWSLDRFYWSHQMADPSASFGTQAQTLSYSARDPAAVWYTFPDDPYLTHMADYVAALAPKGRARLLRYVPLRRVTFSVDDPGQGRLIGKFKRRSRFRDAYQKLELVAAAAARSNAPFKVAAPRGLDAARCLYFQHALDGEDVASMIGAKTAPLLLGRIGELHRAVHCLDAASLPVIPNAAWFAGAAQDLALIGLYMPEVQPRLAHLLPLLQRHLPSDTGFTFCHGDFVCSQLLVAGDRWSITDFDLACQADPYRDIAMFLASLAYDVPYAAADASGARASAFAAGYLTGYALAANQPADDVRLLWHRIAAEIYYLALMLKKDRLDLPWFETRVAQAISFGDRLARA
jgi:aminoglycoside phosphotransferase